VRYSKRVSASERKVVFTDAIHDHEFRLQNSAMPK
jgi:hypothetical protein